MKITPFLLIFFLIYTRLIGHMENLRPPALHPEQVFDKPEVVRLASAVSAGDIKGIQVALEGGTDVNSVGEGGITPIWFALASSNSSAFEYLLRMGADPNGVSSRGVPMLEFCVVAKSPKFLELALKYDGDPNIENRTLKQPIIFRAISGGDIQRIKMLLAAGANINYQRADGTSPAVFASNSRKLEILYFLIENGANPLLQNKAGLDVAAGIFSGSWDESSGLYWWREKVLQLFSELEIKINWEIANEARIRNFLEASGQEPPMWNSKTAKEPNPEWVKLNREKAEVWYKEVMRKPVPPS